MHRESRTHTMVCPLYGSFGDAKNAFAAARLAMESDAVYRDNLDQAIEAMRLTAVDMSVKYKETSSSVRPP